MVKEVIEEMVREMMHQQGDGGRDRNLKSTVSAVGMKHFSFISAKAHPLVLQ